MCLLVLQLNERFGGIVLQGEEDAVGSAVFEFDAEGGHTILIVKGILRVGMGHAVAMCVYHSKEMLRKINGVFLSAAVGCMPLALVGI